MLTDFNPSFKSKHVAPRNGNNGATEFPMDEVIRRLDGESDNMGSEQQQASDSTEVDAAKAIQMLLQWVSKCKARDSRAITYVGKRAIAAAWVINPDLFGNAPGHMVAKSFGISCMKFSWMTAEFSRQFGIRNRFQDHDAKNKK